VNTFSTHTSVLIYRSVICYYGLTTFIHYFIALFQRRRFLERVSWSENSDYQDALQDMKRFWLHKEFHYFSQAQAYNAQEFIQVFLTVLVHFSSLITMPNVCFFMYLCYKSEIKNCILFINFLIACTICRTRKFSDFHSILDKNSILLGYDTVSLGKQFLIFWYHIVVSSAKVKMSDENTPTLEDATGTLSWNI
jgi:hypothetical protein